MRGSANLALSGEACFVKGFFQAVEALDVVLGHDFEAISGDGDLIITTGGPWILTKLGYKLVVMVIDE